MKSSDPVPKHVGSPASAPSQAKWHPGTLVHLSADVTVKGDVVAIIPPCSISVLWFHSGVQQAALMHNLSLGADISKEFAQISAPCPVQGPLVLAREACEVWQTASLVEETLAVILPLINKLACCRQLCSAGKQTLSAVLLEHLCSWPSKVPDITPFGCVSGSVPQWAVEMESKQCFDFWIQKKVDQLHITPTPVASLVGGLSSPSSVASDVSPVNADPTVCYNPNCNEPVDLSVEACRACSYPSAAFDFYCFCGRRCNLQTSLASSPERRCTAFLVAISAE